jgi:hypothetical protein
MTGLPSKWDGVAAKSFFTPLGEVIDCVVFKDQSTGNAKYGQSSSGAAVRGRSTADAGRQTAYKQLMEKAISPPMPCELIPIALCFRTLNASHPCVCLCSVFRPVRLH